MFNLHNNEIVLEKPKRKGQIMIALHAISTYCELTTVNSLEDGYIKGEKIYNKNGLEQKLFWPNILLEEVPETSRTFYLDHPERTSKIPINSPAFRIENEFVLFKEDSTEKKNSFKIVAPNGIGIRVEKPADKPGKPCISDFKDFNQGTDFLIINHKCKSLEQLVEGYMGFLKSKIPYVIQLGCNGSVRDSSFSNELGLEGKIEMIYFTNCIMHAWPFIESNVKELTNKKIEPLFLYCDFLGHKKDSEIEEIAQNLVYSKKDRSVSNYANRIFRLLKDSKNENYFLDLRIKKYLLDFLNHKKEESIKENKNSHKYESLSHFCNRTEGSFGLDDFLARDMFHKSKEELIERKREILRRMLYKENSMTRNKIKEYVEDGLSLKDIFVYGQKLHPILKKPIYRSILIKSAFEDIIKGPGCNDGGAYVLAVLKYFGIPNQRIIENIPEDFISKEFEQSEEWPIPPYLFECYKKERKPYEFLRKKFLKKLQKKGRIKKYSPEPPQKIFFKVEDLKKIFYNKSYFIVPTNIYFFKHKMFLKFAEDLRKNNIPFHRNDSIIGVYDHLRTFPYLGDSIPKKIRNEYFINSLESRGYNFTKSPFHFSSPKKIEKKRNYFANLELFLKD